MQIVVTTSIFTYLAGLALWFGAMLFLVVLFAKALAFGTGAPLAYVCILFALVTTAWHLRLPIKDLRRARRGLPRTAYSGQYAYAFRRATIGLVIMYLVYQVALRLPG